MSIAPFGLPVVPEVYRIRAGESASTATSSTWRGTLRQQVVDSFPAVRALADPQPALHAESVAYLVDGGGMGLVGDEQAGVAVLNVVREFATREPEVERHEYRAEPCGREQRHQEPAVVETDVGHAVARADFARGQHIGEASIRFCSSANDRVSPAKLTADRSPSRSERQRSHVASPIGSMHTSLLRRP